MPETGHSADRIPVALTIAGSDSSGGAGIQADLKTFHQFGVYGASVITAVTAQNTTGISAIHPIPPEMVAEQYIQVMSDIRVDAVKTGMLLNEGIIKALAEAFEEHPPPNLVVDPVMISSSGTPLLDPAALGSMIEVIFPRAALVTPNLDEAAILIKTERVESLTEMSFAAHQIFEMGPGAVLVKGGHLDIEEDAIDVFFDGISSIELRVHRQTIQHAHGTGCVLSSAITAGLVHNELMMSAVENAKLFVTNAFKELNRLGGNVLNFPFYF